MDEDRGLSIRELVLEIREDIKELKLHAGLVPTRREVYGVFVTVVTLAALLWNTLT